MADKEAVSRFKVIYPTFRNPDAAVDLIEASTTHSELLTELKKLNWSLDAYQLLCPAFCGLVNSGVAEEAIVQAIEQKTIDLSPEEMVYYLTQMGGQPYFVLDMMGKLTEESEREFTKEEKVLLYDEGLQVMLRALRMYLGFPLSSK